MTCCVPSPTFTETSGPMTYWVVMPHWSDARSPISAQPLVSFPTVPASNIWQAQNAMIALQRRGIRAHMDQITVYEEWSK